MDDDFDRSVKRPRTDQPPEIPAAVVVDGSERPRPIPNDTYSLLEIPISSCKTVRVGSWASSPIDLDALRKIIPNLHQTLRRKKYSLPSSAEFPDMETIRNDFLRSPSEFPEISLLFKMFGLRSPPEFPEISSVGASDEDGEPFLSATVYKDRAIREELERYKSTFKSQYSYSTMEFRHCITANHASCWMQESAGIMWAGVYGINEICVVTLTGQHLDWNRVHGCLASVSPKLVLTLFRECVLSELEDLADPSCKLSEEFDRSFDPPFCVVSETPIVRDESGHESSSLGCIPEVVDFVKGSCLLKQAKEAKDGGGAIKLAISAFQRLMGKKFEAKEIEVTVLFGRKFGKGYKRDLDISEIRDYLAAVEASQ